jgi:hypothetical protein
MITTVSPSALACSMLRQKDWIMYPEKVDNGVRT